MFENVDRMLDKNFAFYRLFKFFILCEATNVITKTFFFFLSFAWNMN